MQFEFHPRTCALIPTLVITTMECEDPACEVVHGIGLVIAWLFFDISIPLWVFPD